MKRVDNHPLKVTIEAEVDGDMAVVWSGRQQDLFRKNGHRAVPEIKKKLNELKASL